LGTINGFATEARPQRFIADGPTRYSLTETAGEVSPLGQVTVEGTLVGTGFVRDGHPRLWMKITNQLGSVSMGGVGPLVGGFEEP
jgi:hypothetical protein